MTSDVRPTSGIGTEREPQAAGRRSLRQHGPLLALSWSHLLNDGASNYLPGVLPAVLVSLHEPVRMAGVLTAALIAGQALQPATGWLADRLGGRYLSALGLMMSSLGGGLIGVAHSTPALVALLLLIGTGGAFFHPQALAGIRSMRAGKQGLRTSVFLVGGELGRGIWPTAASIVVEHVGLGGLWIVGLPGVLSVPALFRATPKLPRAPEGQPRIHWRRHARPMTLLMGYQCTRALTTYTLVTFIPIQWHLRGGSLVGGSSIITTLLVVGVLGNLAGGHLADRLGRLPVLMTSAIATGVLIFPATYLTGVWIWIAVAPLGIAMFLTSAPAILLGQDIFPENRSMGSGIALGLGNGIGAALVLLIGLLVSGNQVVVVFWVVAALSLVSAALIPLFPASLVRLGAP